MCSFKNMKQIRIRKLNQLELKKLLCHKNIMQKTPSHSRQINIIYHGKDLFLINESVRDFVKK